MTIPLKNLVFEKIKDHGSLTDSELSKALIKHGVVIAEDRFCSDVITSKCMV